MAGTPSARFVIGFDADTSGIDKSKASLDSLKASIQKDTAALSEMKAAMDRLRGTAEVARFEALPRDIAKADNEVKKLADKMAKLKGDFEKAPADKKEGIFAEGLKTQGALDSATKRLAALKAEQEKLGKSEPVKLFNDLRASVEKTKANLGQAQTAFSRMGGTMTGETAKAASGMEQLSEAAGQLPGPLGNIAGKFQSIVKLGPAAALVAVAVAAIAVATGLVVAIGKLVAFGLAMSDAARSAALLRDANAQGAVTGNDLKGVTLAVLDKTNAQEEAVASLVGEYSRLRFSLGAIEGATSAVTVATQAAGQAVGATIKGLIDRGVDTKRFWLNALDLKGTGLALRDVATQLAKQMGIAVGAAEAALRDGRVKLEDGIKAMDAAVEARFGDIAKKQMLALPVQIERVKKNLATLFSGLKIDTFLEKLDGALSLFKETEVVGKALRQVFSVALQPFIDTASDGMPLVEGFIYGVVLALQTLTILGLKAAIVFKKMWGQSEALKDLDMIKVGIYGGVAAVAAFAGVLGALAIVLGTVAVGLLVISAPLLLISAIAVGIGYAIGWMIDTVTTTIDDFVTYLADTGTSMEDAAADIIEGLTNGIADGVAAVGKAFKDLALAGLKSFKSALGIASPSKVFMAESAWIPVGTAKGIEKGTPKVSSALAKMADPAAMQAEGAGQTIGARLASAAGKVYNVVLNYYGNGSREDAARFVQMLGDEFESNAIMEGTAG